MTLKNIISYIVALLVLLLVVVALGLRGKIGQVPEKENKLAESLAYLSEPKLSPNNQIAFVKGNDLYIADIDGRNILKLTVLPDAQEQSSYNKTTLVDFQWSHDGKKIAYAYINRESKEQFKPSEFVLEVFALDSGQTTRLVQGSSSTFLTIDSGYLSLSWAVDDQAITFRGYKEAAKPIFFSVSIGSKAQEVLVKNVGSVPNNWAFSSDRKKFTYSDSFGNFMAVYILARDTKKVCSVDLASVFGEMVWSTDNRYLAYEKFSESGRTDVGIFDTKTKSCANIDAVIENKFKSNSFYIGNMEEIKKGRSFDYSEFKINFIRWLEGNRILFATEKTYIPDEDETEYWKIEGKGLDFWTLDIGNNKLEHLGGFTLKDPAFKQLDPDFIVSPTLSYDLKKVVFKRGFGPDYKRSAVYSANLDGSEIREIIDNVAD